MEVRLGDQARLSKDIDLGLRVAITTAGVLTERLVEALSLDPTKPASPRAGDHYA